MSSVHGRIASQLILNQIQLAGAPCLPLLQLQIPEHVERAHSRSPLSPLAFRRLLCSRLKTTFLHFPPNYLEGQHYLFLFFSLSHSSNLTSQSFYVFIGVDCQRYKESACLDEDNGRRSNTSDKSSREMNENNVCLFFSSVL